MMNYVYTSIQDLKPGLETQNFYGKIVFIGKDENRITILLKDETGSIYLNVTPLADQELKFELRQVLRIHRCKITPEPKEGVAEIAKNGCHLVAWSHTDDVSEPAVVSSAKWTPSKKDNERRQALHELGRSTSKTSLEEMIYKLASHREEKRTGPKVASWLNRSVIHNKHHLAQNVLDLFSKPVGSVIEPNFCFSVDGSFFEKEDSHEIIQFVIHCPDCFKNSHSVTYASKGESTECSLCQNSEGTLKVAILVRIICDKYKITFTIPIDLLSGGGYKSYTDPLLQSFHSDNNDGQFQEQVEKLCRILQTVLQNAALSKLKGVVVKRSEESKDMDIYVEKVKFLDYLKLKDLKQIESSKN